MDLIFQVPGQYCSLASDLASITITSTTGCYFCFGSIPSLFLELFLHWSPVAYWAPADLGSSSFSVLSICLFILAVTDCAELWLWGATHCPRSGAAAERSYPMSSFTGGCREELARVWSQGQRPRGASSPPRSGGCVGAGGPRGATPRSRSGGRPWGDTARPR